MSSYSDLLSKVRSQKAMERFARLYGRRDGEMTRQISRYTALVKSHQEAFGEDDAALFLVSAPGRTEIIGNHTDHNRGLVMAAAVNLDCIACVSPRADLKAILYSRGYPAVEIDLDDLEKKPEEAGTSAALVRGVARGMRDNGFRLGGFSAVVTSDVLGGSGLSSSAAYEVMVCAVLDALYNGFTMDSTLRAKISQYAENEYFGKPSGLMDQMACSTGGLVAIDFRNEPAVTPLSFSFQEAGYSLVVVNTGGSHDNLTAEYASIRSEMEAVAAHFGKQVLREVRPEQMMQAINEIRKTAGERAVLRAMHFYDENRRVKQMISAVREGNADQILKYMIESGESSWMLLQNVYPAGPVQPMALALELASGMLKGRGAWRVHGGGFAGTTLNAVPNGMTEEFVARMESVFGEKSCFILDVRPEGAAVVLGSEEE
ncbi:MAG: galactokinase [Clostridiales bacterium]|nr:galactokinase [Clostridiales bacterium]